LILWIESHRAPWKELEFFVVVTNEVCGRSFATKSLILDVICIVVRAICSMFWSRFIINTTSYLAVKLVNLAEVKFGTIYSIVSARNTYTIHTKIIIKDGKKRRSEVLGIKYKQAFTIEIDLKDILSRDIHLENTCDINNVPKMRSEYIKINHRIRITNNCQRSDASIGSVVRTKELFEGRRVQ